MAVENILHISHRSGMWLERCFPDTETTTNTIPRKVDLTNLMHLINPGPETDRKELLTLLFHIAFGASPDEVDHQF
jgi:hypothetical protein